MGHWRPARVGLQALRARGGGGQSGSRVSTIRPGKSRTRLRSSPRATVRGRRLRPGPVPRDGHRPSHRSSGRDQGLALDRRLQDPVRLGGERCPPDPLPPLPGRAARGGGPAGVGSHGARRDALLGNARHPAAPRGGTRHESHRGADRRSARGQPPGQPAPRRVDRRASAVRTTRDGRRRIGVAPIPPHAGRLHPVRLAAQAPLARVTVGGGSGTDLRGVRSGAYVVSPSVTLFTGAASSFGLAGRATRFTNDEWSLGGSTGFSGRTPLGDGSRLNLVLDASGDATWASYHATYLQAAATPALELRMGSLALWGGARGAAARAAIRQTLAAPMFGQGSLGQAPDTIVRRSAVGPAFGLSLDLAQFAPGQGVRLTYREEHSRPDGTAVTDRTAALTMARGPVGLPGSLGVRDTRGENRAFGGGQLVLSVARGVAVFAAAESYPSNRLTGAVGGRSLSAGLSLSTGGIGAPRALPKPPGGVPPPARFTPPPP